MDKDELLKLLEDDDLGLLKVKPKSSNVMTADERLLNSFEEVNRFVDEQGREPASNPKNISEHRLYLRLKALKEDASKVEALQEQDRHGLFPAVDQSPPDESSPWAETLGLLDEAESIFQLRHVPKDFPDYVAQRKPCKDFEQFEPLLVQCQKEIKAGQRTLSKFQQEQEIRAGHFFVLNGVLLYVAEEGERETTGGKVNARLRCIFENGTESNMLLRSLAAELYKNNNGRRVSKPVDSMLESLEGISHEDVETGCIYVIRSLSQKPEISSLENLYKIGFSKGSAEDRIKNASEEATYLMAPVEIVTTYRCFNFKAQKFEHLLHRFFGNACLDIEIRDKNGVAHRPKEWFIAPFSCIEEAIKLLLDEKIVDYYYDAQASEICKR